MAARFEVVARTGSTNADLLERLAAGEHVPEGYWLIAERQSAGRGRQGRAWLDAPGNFMGSTVVHLHSHEPPPATLSFVAALAVYEAVLPRLPQPAALQLKWPNDVLLGGAKFCGLLLEREGPHTVVGIGVNVAAAPEVDGRATDSLAEHGPPPLPAAFATELAFRFDQELARWREFGLGPILTRWQAAAHLAGSELTVHETATTRLTGRFDGLEPDGAMRLRLADGAVRVIHAGDVTLGA